MTASKIREILILAGPNGAGKTTFAREFLLHEAHCPTFINADLIAAGLSPFNPELVAIRAGRLMVQMMREHVERGESFAFETTCRSWLRPLDSEMAGVRIPGQPLVPGSDIRRGRD
ncbi:MAG TPA: hypothetical protein VH062_03025 [Polyangiaceae bacterium]|jgi:predicted ABC-type ATPase|nr:hypothetical protein [Polyangiaceae bacterium]